MIFQQSNFSKYLLYSLLNLGLLTYGGYAFTLATTIDTYVPLIALFTTLVLLMVWAIPTLSKFIATLPAPDYLLSIPNRSSCIYEIEAKIDFVGSAKKTVVLALVNIDNFKILSESYGHTISDLIIRKVVDRLTILYSSFYRVSDHTFAIIQIVDTPHDAFHNIELLHTSLNVPIKDKDQIFKVTSSIGVTSLTDTTSAVTLFRYAEIAAKEAGKRGGVVLRYSSDLDEADLELLQAYNDLSVGIKNKDLVNHYQLTLNLSTNTFKGVETLVRWNHPTKGLVYPDKFIGMAETTGLITDLTLTVLDRALEDLAFLHQVGFTNIEKVSVNLSPFMEISEGFALKVTYLLQKYYLKPCNLKFEITESIVKTNQTEFKRIIKMLEESGIDISLDDFGTGQSSLLYLKSLPIHELKVDKSFVLDMCNSDADYYIVQSIISLSKWLDCVSVAEGIETYEAQQILTNMGCMVGQGYFIAKPKSINEVVKHLSSAQYNMLQ